MLEVSPGQGEEEEQTLLHPLLSCTDGLLSLELETTWRQSGDKDLIQPSSSSGWEKEKEFPSDCFPQCWKNLGREETNESVITCLVQEVTLKEAGTITQSDNNSACQAQEIPG